MWDLWIYRLQTGSQKTVIERMMKAIEHRGPDSEGSLCRRRLLAFEDLVLLILEDGQQLYGKCGWKICILFLMEKSMIIKNCGQNLRLSAFLHPFRYGSLGKHQQYGEKALDKLRGMFGLGS